VYSTEGRLTSVTQPENGTVTYTYHADGTVATKVDAKNQKVVYTYDAYKRVTMVKRYPVSAGAEDECQRAEYFYDTNPFDGGFSQSAWGRLTARRYFRCLPEYKMTLVDMYSYTSGGLVTKKRLRLSRPADYNPGGPESSFDLTAEYSYGAGGRITSMKYPVWGESSGPTLNYSYDGAGRLSGLTETGGATLVSGVAYSHRGQLAQMVYGGGTETRQYNELGQLTRIQMPATLNQAAFDVEYVYSATQNNGRMVGQKDWLTGEEVVYEYDSLNRLAAAATAGPQWGLTFGYDGFGNKTGQTVTKGTGPSYTVGVNAATNRIVGYSYDANGNQVVAAGTAYDIENRLAFHLNEHYGYSPDNERVLVRKAGGGWLQDRVSFYGVTGQVLVEYAAYWVTGEPGGLTLYGLGTRRYFGGKEIHSSLSARLMHDRLGSMVQWGNTRYGFYPFGEPKGTAGYAGGAEYATYRKDETGLHYAVNRYYNSQQGRFVTPDPYLASGGAGELEPVCVCGERSGEF
jgi:RHS repeat-associated protein